MESVEIPGRLEPDRLLEVFYSATHNVDYKNKHSGPNSEVVVITGSKFFLRYRISVGFALFSYYDGTTTKIDYGIVGLGPNRLSLGFGAAKDVVVDITNGIGNLIRNGNGKSGESNEE